MLFCWFVILDAKVQNFLGVKGVKELKGVKGHYHGFHRVQLEDGLAIIHPFAPGDHLPDFIGDLIGHHGL